MITARFKILSDELHELSRSLTDPHLYALIATIGHGAAREAPLIGVVLQLAEVKARQADWIGRLLAAWPASSIPPPAPEAPAPERDDGVPAIS